MDEQKYVCPECDYTQDFPGTCSDCDTELEKEVGETPDEEATGEEPFEEEYSEEETFD